MRSAAAPGPLHNTGHYGFGCITHHSFGCNMDHSWTPNGLFLLFVYTCYSMDWIAKASISLACKFANLIADLSHNILVVSVVRIFMCCKLVRTGAKILKKFMQIFCQNMSQDYHATVVLQSYDILTSVAKLSP